MKRHSRQNVKWNYHNCNSLTLFFTSHVVALRSKLSASRMKYGWCVRDGFIAVVRSANWSEKIQIP